MSILGLNREKAQQHEDLLIDLQDIDKKQIFFIIYNDLFYYILINLEYLF